MNHQNVNNLDITLETSTLDELRSEISYDLSKKHLLPYIEDNKIVFMKISYKFDDVFLKC